MTDLQDTRGGRIGAVAVIFVAGFLAGSMSQRHPGAQLGTG
jgi:hypothetical protein